MDTRDIRVCTADAPLVPWQDSVQAALGETGRTFAETVTGSPNGLTHDAVLPGDGRAAGVMVTDKMWRNGRHLRVRFLEGSDELNRRVFERMQTWQRHANIAFVFSDDSDAEIRISYSRRGSWSYIGTDALTRPRDEPTMNFGWIHERTPENEVARVVLHETGHALGMPHEHQNPAGGIPWDRQAVYDYYSGPPNNWDRDQIDRNIFARYSESQTSFTELDTDSIMMYAIPNELTIGDFEVGWNRKLSPTDKRFIGERYPFPEEPEEPDPEEPDPGEPEEPDAGELLERLLRKLRKRMKELFG